MTRRGDAVPSRTWPEPRISRTLAARSPALLLRNESVIELVLISPIRTHSSGENQQADSGPRVLLTESFLSTREPNSLCLARELVDPDRFARPPGKKPRQSHTRNRKEGGHPIK